MEFKDVLPLLPFQPQSLDKQFDLLDNLETWFNSPTHLKSVIDNRLRQIFEQQEFDDIYNTHQRILGERLYKAQQTGHRLNPDTEFGNVLKGLAQIKLGRDISFTDPGFKLLTSLVRRKSLKQ